MTNSFKHTHVTPEFRAFIRAEMSTAVIKPIDSRYADAARILSLLVPQVVAGISDVELDRMILETLDPYILRRNQF